MRIFSINNFRLIIVCFMVCASINELIGGMAKQGDDTKYQAVPDSGIRKCLNEMNDALATKDLQKVMSIYDNSDDIVVVGSDSGEIFIGKKRVEVFMKIIVSMPFIFSFDMDKALIQQDNNIAWVFIDTKMVHTKENGKSSMIPYRITGVLVKKGSDWKWRLFSGSIPRGE